jgi:hypothetical protein
MGTFQRQLPNNRSGFSNKDTYKIVPDLLIRASHLWDRPRRAEIRRLKRCRQYFGLQYPTRPFTIRQHLYYSRGYFGEKARRAPRSH